MAGQPRLNVTNRIAAAATLLSASSEQPSAPKAWLKDQLRSKTWRSKLGWNVRAGENDKLDFTEGVTGDATATLTAGNYATGAALATEIQTQMDAAATDNTYTVTYSGSTNKFTIARATGTATFGLEWATGANATTSIGRDLGFDVSADDTGLLSYEGDNASFKSREWVKADLGSPRSVASGIVINHNLGAVGTIRLQGNATDVWTSPTVDQLLTGNADIRIAYIAEQSLRYWRLLIDDVSSNTAGYSEVGIWSSGPNTQPTVGYSIDFALQWQQLSEVSVAISGAHFQDERPQRPVWSLVWSEVPEADRALLRAALKAVPRGKSFFFTFDATTPLETEYVYLDAGFQERLTSGLYFDIPLPVLAGALG